MSTPESSTSPTAGLPSDQDLIDTWKNQEAPLLPLLHAFHERDGMLTDEALKAVSEGLRTPLTDLYGTVTFYHFFARVPEGRNAPRVCDGPVCRTRGSQELLDKLRAEGATPMPCAGRCDEPIPVLKADRYLIGSADGSLVEQPTPIPVPNPGGIEECAFSGIREQGRATLCGYQESEGYTALENAVHNGSPEAVVQTVTDSKLAGRGGAGFPTGIKWKAVAEAEGHPKSIICNADEGEPGCFKDRALMDHDPHALIEGMVLAAYATGATRGFIYLRYEYPHTMAILEKAIAEAKAAGYLGKGICGKEGFDFELYVRRGAGAYICGEETSLLESLEGKHPFPRNKPPYPVTHGYENLPTVINNVETLCCVPTILRKGAEWYQGLGLGEHAGTKLVSLSGDVQKPGNYEVPFGLPLLTLLNDWAGGPKEGRKFQAVTMAGLSGGFLGEEHFDVTLDEPSIRSRGSFLGAAGIIVFDDSRDMVQMALEAIEFFRHESCGKCFPCRIGCQRLEERLHGTAGSSDPDEFIRELEDIGDAMKTASACGLGVATPNVTDSLIRDFRPALEKHVVDSRRGQ
ncbi:MAG: NADH-ubiquinone oxidoreductase-F iron-sulfur binding region domain-containing protein [Planctomycetota bacterium]